MLAGSCLNRSTEFLERGLWNHELCDPDTAASGGVYLPLGPWPVAETLDETHVLQYVGVLMRQVFLNIHRAYHSILLRHGLTRAKVEQWSQDADEGELIIVFPSKHLSHCNYSSELNTNRFKLWVRFRFCWARRREGPNLPALPLPAIPTAEQDTTSDNDRPPSPAPIPYRVFDVFHNREEAAADTQRRQRSVGALPEPAVRRAWRNMVQL
jgi:hypothetical protein